MIANENSIYEQQTINNRNVNSKNDIVKPKTPATVKLNNRFDRLTVRGNRNIETFKTTI